MTFQIGKKARKLSCGSLQDEAAMLPQAHSNKRDDSSGQKDRMPGGYENCICLDERFFEADEDIQRQFYGY